MASILAVLIIGGSPFLTTGASFAVAETRTSSTEKTVNSSQKEEKIPAVLEKEELSEVSNFSSSETNTSIEKSEKSGTKTTKKEQQSLTRATTTGTWGTVPWFFESETGTLTFTGGGTLGESTTSPWRVNGELNNDAIVKIVFTEKVTAPVNSFSLFGYQGRYLNNLTSFENLSYLDTSQVTNMGQMFWLLGKLTSLDVSHLDTSRVTNMGSMFSGVSSITELDVSSFDTSQSNSMREMFAEMPALKSLDLSNFDTSQVYSMSHMFTVGTADSQLETLDVSSFDTSLVFEMDFMFFGLNKLKSLDLKSFNTSQVWNMDYMFQSNDTRKDHAMTYLNVSSFDTSGVTTMAGLFTGLNNLTSLDVSSFDTSQVTSFSQMFQGMSKLTSLDLSSFSFVSSFDTAAMFDGDTSLSSLTLSATFSDPNNQSVLPNVPTTNGYTGNWKKKDGISVGTTSEFLKNYDGSNPGTYVWETDNQQVWGDVPYSFDSTSGILAFTGGGTLGDYTTSPWNREDKLKISSSSIKKIIFTQAVNAPADSSYLFSIDVYDMDKPGNLSAVTSIEGLSLLNTSQVTNMNSMFSHLDSLKELNLSHFDTSQVTNMSGMFQSAVVSGKIETLELSSFDTSQVTDMSGMFAGQTELRLLDVSSFNTSQVTDMSFMFMLIPMFGNDLSLINHSLTVLDLSSFDTSNVTNMQAMFAGADGLKTLDITGFETSQVTNMNSMFLMNSNLSSIDVSHFDTSNVMDMGQMFMMMTSLTSLDLSSFDMHQVKDITDIFTQDALLSRLTLSETFKDPTNTSGLPAIVPTDMYTGNWQKENGEIVGSSDDFLKNYDGSDPGTYTWESAGDTLDPNDPTQTALVLESVPSAFTFKSKLKQGTYILKDNLPSGQQINVKNDRMEREWSVKANVVDNQFTATNKQRTTYSLIQFMIDGSPLLGTGATGIVAQSVSDKTTENNVGTIQKDVSVASILFSDEDHTLKADTQLSGVIRYQLYNTVIAE